MDSPYKKPFSIFSRLNSERSATQASDVRSDVRSSISSASSRESRLEDDRGELGLTTLYEPSPSSSSAANIIFIHGLGGSSRKTWCHSSSEVDQYWPQTWLPSDPDFVDVCIHVFGYNANWIMFQRGVLNVHDFAQSLVAELKNNPIMRRDVTPIILVGHSMGGCVAKKAYILAHQDPGCDELVKRVRSIFFLSTPHRGSDLASTLENILALARSHTPFVNDLAPNSAALTEINDTFRHYAQKLHLWSFYETLPVKRLNKLVVEKQSATLGYPGEEIAAMNADHRHVCKFSSRDDPNYRILRNALQREVEAARGSRPKEQTVQPSDFTQLDLLDALPSPDTDFRLKAFLSADDTVADELTNVEVQKEPGSCEWLTDSTYFSEWEQGAGRPILWVTGRPAAGKSVLSGHVVNQFRSSTTWCSYFFFKHSKRGKSTLRDCFLSLAYQMTTIDEFVRRNIIRLLSDQVNLDTSDEVGIWRKLFTGIIFKSPHLSRHCWVIDGMDECANFSVLFKKRLLADVPSRLRVFATSRDMEEVGRGLAALEPKVHLHLMSEDDTRDDIQSFVSARLSELNRMEDEDAQEAFCHTIIQRSRGSFLWVRLVLQELEHAWTEEDMKAVLDDTPAELHDVYRRILQSIDSDPRKKTLAKSILTWVVLAPRPLLAEELRCAIKLDIDQTLQNLVKAVPHLCGQFVFVDQANKVQIIHDTARQFLQSADLNSELVIRKNRDHTRLAALLLRYLSSDALKPTQTVRSTIFKSAKSSKVVPADTALVSYAARFFSHHIYCGTSEDDGLIQDLCSFLKSQNVLFWIEEIARKGELGHMTRTATNLRGYLRRRAKYVSQIDPQTHIVECWVVDLIRVAAKFRSQLLACPASIHCLIPPLCPPDSIISRTFSEEARLAPLVVKNLPRGTWDDCLLRIDFRKGFPSVVDYGDKFLAVGLSTRLIYVYDSVSTQRVAEMRHPERIKILMFSPGDQFLVSCGLKNLIVWDTRTGVLLVSSPLSSLPLAISFLEHDELLLASQPTKITKWNLETGEFDEDSWLESEDPGFPIEDLLDQPPSRAAMLAGPLSDDLLLALGYRNSPIHIWDIREGRLSGRCGMENPNGVEDMAFNPNPDILALVVAYADGSLCLCNYFTLEVDFVRPGIFANSLQCSQDGRTLVTGSSQGAIHVFEFDMGETGETVLVPIYHIKATDDLIRGVAFGSDGLRFADLGRRQCRIWEPAALAKRDAELESTSEALTLQQEAVDMPKMTEYPQITTPLAASKDGRAIVAGRGDGKVVVFSGVDGSELGIVYSHARRVSVISLLLANSDRLIISADESGRVLVAEVPKAVSQLIPRTGPAQQLPSAKIVLDRRFGSAVVQMLVDAESKRLLVGGREVIELWELPTGTVLGTRQTTLEQTPSGDTQIPLASANIAVRTIFQHPTISSLFVIKGNAFTRLFQWTDFAQTAEVGGTQPKQPASPTVGSPTGKVSYHAGPGVIIEHIHPPLYGLGRLILWPATAFDPLSKLAGQPSTDMNLDSISSAVLSVLGVVEGSKLLFLDHNLWVCSTDLPSSAATPNIDNTGYAGRRRALGPMKPAASMNRQTGSGHTRRHFFALNEWRDGHKTLNCAILASEKPSFQGRHGVDFAFAAGHRVVIVQDGLEFSEVVTKAPSRVDGSPSKATSLNGDQWTYVSGSMHKRVRNR